MNRTLAALLAALVGLALASWSLLDSRRVAQIAGEHEIAARTARSLLRAAEARAEGQDLAAERAQLEIQRLESELDSALTYAHAIGEALTQQSESAEQAAVARASAEAIVSVPPPMGVQRSLQTLRECLIADGFPALRPLRASRLADHVLYDIEMLDVGGAVTAAELVVAARLTVTLDRARGELLLRFHDGFQRIQGVRTDLPAAGLCVRLAPVAGPMWEARLPFLVQAEGEYPVELEPGRAPAGSLVDAVTRAHWLERLDLLTQDAGTELELRVAGFDGLAQARFRAVHLVGYDSRRLLALTADCAELAVEIDDRAGIVSLLLKDGTLRREGVESTIHAEGYRMLLPNVTPRRAADLMFGMVVHR